MVTDRYSLLIYDAPCLLILFGFLRLSALKYRLLMITGGTTKGV